MTRELLTPGPAWMSRASAEEFFGWPQRAPVQQAWLVTGIDGQQFVFVAHESGYRVYSHGRCFDPRHTVSK